MLRACFMEARSALKVAAYGMNKYTDGNTNGKSVHAERDAINKLPKRDYKNLKEINIIVIKTSKTGCVGSSKPCLNCLIDMTKFAPKMGYKIKWVYYSNQDGTITRNKLNHLLDAGNFHVSSYYKNRNFKHPLLE